MQTDQQKPEDEPTSEHQSSQRQQYQQQPGAFFPPDIALFFCLILKVFIHQNWLIENSFKILIIVPENLECSSFLLSKYL